MAHPFIACVFEMWNDMQFRYEVLKHFMSLRIGVILTYKNSIYNNRNDNMNRNKYNSASSDSKIKVFISSKCDKAGETPKYGPIRAELKQEIEKTGLANVYVFEDEEASTLSAGNHYIFALEDSDVCIFLIDNADGISEGVKAEIDVVRKNNKKALYYFCDENKKEKTALEKSLMGASFAKSKTVHTFGDLSKNSAAALIEDIILIYHCYCNGKLREIDENSQNETQGIDITTVSKYQESSLPKAILKNIDKSADYILRHTTGQPLSRFPDDSVQTCELDGWGIRFLPILFEGKSIKEFNTSLFLDCLKETQQHDYFEVINLRWKAIQSYFNDNITKCIEYLQIALATAKNTNQPHWLIKDILIDLRNQHFELCTERNAHSSSEAQKELDASEDELYYPILDRNNETLLEKYIQGLYKEKIESPYTVSLGNDFNQYGKLLASALIVALYNGSLTHILSLYDKVKDFLFYLSSRYADWNFRRDLLKYAIKTRKEKEVLGIQNTYPEILGKLSEMDAENIMQFCSHHPIYYKRCQQQLLAFGSVGYYLSDEAFKTYESQIMNCIFLWLDDEHAAAAIGQSIFNNLSNISYRLSQDVISDICCKFIDKHNNHWYIDMFKFMSRRINISEMNEEHAVNLIEHIILALQNEGDRKQIQSSPAFLCVIRKQNRDLSENLDKEIKKYLPIFYENEYVLETSNNETTGLSQFIEKYVLAIKNSNETQGEMEHLFGRSIRKIATIRSVLIHNDLSLSDSLMDSIIEAVSQSLLGSKKSISTKMDAVALLCCIIAKYPCAYLRNKSVYQRILDNEEQISTEDELPFSSNVDSVALRISLKILSSAMGFDIHTDLIELLPYLNDNVATIITVSNFIAEYLEISEEIVFSKPTEPVILYNTFAWIHMSYVDIRWNATRILLALLRNPDNQDVINRQIISLIDRENVYIKNLILQRISGTPGITEATKNYAFEVCEHDANYVTRKLCKDIKH